MGITSVSVGLRNLDLLLSSTCCSLSVVFGFQNLYLNSILFLLGKMISRIIIPMMIGEKVAAVKKDQWPQCMLLLVNFRCSRSLLVSVCSLCKCSRLKFRIIRCSRIEIPSRGICNGSPSMFVVLLVYVWLLIMMSQSLNETKYDPRRDLFVVPQLLSRWKPFFDVIRIFWLLIGIISSDSGLIV